jgi:hypothetical protein
MLMLMLIASMRRQNRRRANVMRRSRESGMLLVRLLLLRVLLLLLGSELRQRVRLRLPHQQRRSQLSDLVCAHEQPTIQCLLWIVQRTSKRAYHSWWR